MNVPIARIALIIVALAGLAATHLAPASGDVALETRAAPQPASPELHIERDASGVSVSGHVSSVAHEAILRDLVGRGEPGNAVSFDVHEIYLLPPGWGLVTELALRAALLTQFSETEVTSTGVSIRGVTADAHSWTAAMSRLEAALLPGMRLETRVAEFQSTQSFESLCRQQFDALLKTRTLEFPIAASALDSSAMALLDGLIETASDCPGALIEVRGSGDGPSSITANRILAEDRTRSIVDYLTDRGLPEDRIVALPPFDNATARARQFHFAISFVPESGSGERTAGETPAAAGNPSSGETTLTRESPAN